MPTHCLGVGPAATDWCRLPLASDVLDTGGEGHLLDGEVELAGLPGDVVGAAPQLGDVERRERPQLLPADPERIPPTDSGVREQRRGVLGVS